MTATKTPTEPPSTRRVVRRPGDRIFAGSAKGSGIFILLVLAGVAAFLISEDGQAAAAENAGNAPISDTLRSQAQPAVDAISAG